MTVAEMLQRIGSSEIAEWNAEYRLRAREEREAIEAARKENQLA